MTAQRIEEVAAALGCSPRRVRRLREDGDFVARDAGMLDAPHAFNAHCGRGFVEQRQDGRPGQKRQRRSGSFSGIAVSRLAPPSSALAPGGEALGGSAPKAASAVLANASARLGENAPRFAVGAPRGAA